MKCYWNAHTNTYQAALFLFTGDLSLTRRCFSCGPVRWRFLQSEKLTFRCVELRGEKFTLWTNKRWLSSFRVLMPCCVWLTASAVCMCSTTPKASLTLHASRILIRKQEKKHTKFKSLSKKKGRVSETGNILLPSTHQSDINSSEREDPHVNTEPLEAQRAETMGKRLLWICSSCNEGPFTVSTTLTGTPSSPPRHTGSQISH